MSRLRFFLSDVSAAAVLSLILLLTGALSPVWSRPPTQPEVIAAGRTKDATKSSRKPSGPSFDVVSKRSPESVADLRAIENRVKSLARKVTRCTVAVRRGQAQGSGVIVSQDGYVLTAAHVCGSAGRKVDFTLFDGRIVKGVTLGLYRTVDAGLMKITEDGEWPFADMGDSTKLKLGEWCVATGHPGGYQQDRPPVLRLGRVVLNRSNFIQTDCPLVGGDSGGPLFDLQGKVIGINSRIGASANWNFHVPIKSYSDHWDRLAASEVWGGRESAQGAVLGVGGEDHQQGCKVTEVVPGYPAEKAGLRVGDVIVRLDDKPVKGIGDLAERIREMRPDAKVKLEIIRGVETIEKTVRLASRR